MPELSIITVNLNNASGLKRTIDSVSIQSFKDYEYIIIDGGSTDNSKDIIQDHLHLVNYWISEPDHGIYHAMNKGIEQSKGKYCLFLNSGDYLYEPETLGKVFPANSIAEIIYGNLILKNNKGERIQHFPDKLTFYWLFSEYLGHQSTFIKRSLFDHLGLYNEKYKVVSDWEFFLIAIAKNNCTTRHLSFPVAVLIEGGVSNHPDYSNLVITERDEVMKKHFSIFYNDYIFLTGVKNKGILRKVKRIIRPYYQTIVRVFDGKKVN